MVLADRGHGLVQVVAADVADLLVAFRDQGFRLLPVAAELRFATHRPLITGKALWLFPEAVDRLEDRAIGERSEAVNVHVNAHDRSRRVHRFCHLALGLD